MYCVSCGKEIEDGAQFCEHCGAKQEEVPAAGQQAAAAPAAEGKSAASPQGVPAAPDPAVTPIGAAPMAGTKKPMSPKTKLILALVAGTVVLFFGLKLILGAVNSPNRTINRFIEAIRNQDVDAFNQVTELSLYTFEFDEEDLAPFFAAYSTDNATLTAYQNALLEDLTYLERGLVAPGNGFVRLVEDSNFLFSSYKVELTLIPVTICSEFDHTDLSMAGKAYIADSDGVGPNGAGTPLLPGLYSGSASYTDPDTGVTLTTEFAGYRIDSDNSYLYVEFGFVNAYIESSYRELELKAIDIDGNPYAGDLSGFDFYGGFELGPVNADSEIRVVASAGGMEFEQTFSMADSVDCFFIPAVPEEIAAEAAEIAADVLPLYMEMRYSYSESACDELVSRYGEGSEMVAFLAEWLEETLAGIRGEYNMSYDGSYYVFTDLQMDEASVGIIRFEGDSVLLSVCLPTSGTYDLYYEWDDPEPSETESFSGNEYVWLRYTDGQFFVDDFAAAP